MSHSICATTTWWSAYAVLMLVLVQVVLLLHRPVWQKAKGLVLEPPMQHMMHSQFQRTHATENLAAARFHAHLTGHLSCKQAAHPVS
jgi:hypothetical protein